MFEKISFYIVPHADDWQLFMQPNVHADLVSAECKIIFIVTTAGDAGIGEKYWRAREEGFKSSVRFGLAHLGAIREFNGSRRFGRSLIHYWRVNEGATYFLRLPDGNIDGSGFAASNFDSLFKLKSREISTIASLDQGTTYNNWSDFPATIESIINLESQGITNVWINYLNPDLNENPGDHSDHIATGHAVQNITTLKNFKHLLFTGYNVSVNGKGLSVKDLFWKIGMFAAYEQTVYNLSGYSTLQEGVSIYVKWCSVTAKYLSVLPN